MTCWRRTGGRPEGTAAPAPCARGSLARPARRPAVLLALLALCTAPAVVACGAGSTPVTIGPASTGAAGPACVEESGQRVCVTGAPAADAGTDAGEDTGDGPTTSSAAADPTPDPTPDPSRTSRRPSASADRWGGGTRVGSFTTRGTVRGVQAGDSQERRATGTCDVARDVRTVSASLGDDSTLVVRVTGKRVASVTLTVRGGSRWEADYVGTSAAAVVTLTPTRTVVRGARLAVTSGPDAPPVTVDADFDC